MKETMQNIMEQVENLANMDQMYQHMLQENEILEEKFDHMVKNLSGEDRAAAWDFVMHCEDMSIRKLELACSLISDKE